MAAYPRHVDELRECVGFGGVDLAPILAELGRDEVHLERRVDLLLRQRGDLLTALLGAHPVEPVLVEKELSPKSEAAQPHVVFLRTREVEQGGAERPRGDDPQVDLQATVDDDRALRVSAREHALDGRGAGEDLEDRRGIVARHDDVDVADRFLVAPQAARDLDLRDAGLRAKVLHHPRRGRPRLMEKGAPRPLLERGDRAEDVLLGLRLDLRELLEPVVFRGFLELFDRGDLQMVVDGARGGGADARHA
jgi:hypothetical protein